MHRSLSGAAAAAALLAAGLTAAPAAHAEGAPWMALPDVKPGMQCTVASVIQGLEPTTFDATIIGTTGGPRPADALILARFSGDAIKDTGIGQGFSGSPVTCPGADGVPRVVGAIAQGIGQYDNFVAGLTPIEAMLATPTFADAPAAPPVGQPSTNSKAASAKRGSKKRNTSAKTSSKANKTAMTASAPWGTGRTPLTLSGPRGAFAQNLLAAADRAKFPLLISPMASRSQAPAGGVKPGDAVAVTTVSGDVSAGAVGTATYVDGAKVWAFGHPFNGTGPARLTLERAAITSVIGSPAIGDQVTYKLGAPVGPVGTIGFDGTAAVGGLLGATPPTIPVTATIRDAAGATVGGGTSAVTDERAVRGGNTSSLLPLAAASNAGTALQRLTTQPSAGGSARTCTHIRLKNGLKPLDECVDTVVTEPSALGGLETGIADATGGAVAGITIAERYLRLVDNIHVDVTYRNEADDLEIVRVKQPKSIRAGKTITIRVVVVQGSTGDSREIPVNVKIPKSAKGQKTGIVVLSGPAGLSEDALLEELFEDEESIGGAVPKNLDALRKGYTNDGLSGLRVGVIPGISGKAALEALSGEAEDSDLDDEEFEALASQVKLAYELPTYFVEGSASTSVTPR